MSESLTLLPGFKSHLGQLLPVSVSHCRSAVRLRQTRTGPPALTDAHRATGPRESDAGLGQAQTHWKTLSC